MTLQEAAWAAAYGAHFSACTVSVCRVRGCDETGLDATDLAMIAGMAKRTADLAASQVEWEE